MTKKIILGLFLAFFLCACTAEDDYPEQKQLVIDSLAAGEKMPKVHAGELYGGIVFMGEHGSWFVSQDEVLAIDEQAKEMSPGIKYAPASVIMAAYDALVENKDLSSLKSNPPLLPPHLNIKYDQLSEQFAARMSDKRTLLSLDEAPYKVASAQWDSRPKPISYFPKGAYEIEEVGGWVTALSAVVDYSRNSRDQDNEYNLIPMRVLEILFEFLAPGSAQELHEKLIAPLIALTDNETEFRHNGYLYKSWREEESDPHPDYPGREYIYLTVVAEETAGS